ncbi:hypothetical protein PRUB_a4640 [Pseudoalteromonas rubra]|uniref:DAGKc domain-containing protein n=1 Tax=Pseudoalteromonas rubra TaxID=43658 RepID=A0A8T0CC25_9GAMM|nr:hypothetical protein PRUB_a4640 [Pseudoalteromonas rubra]
MQRHVRWLRAQAEQRQITLSWYETTGFYGRDYDAIRLLLQVESAVVVVGGDGTINLVVNAMCGSSAQLACLPAGTGNDFCRQFGYTEKQWRATVFSSHCIALDLGAIGERCFVNIAGVGFNADVVQSLRGQKHGGALSYVWGGLKQLFCAPTIELKTAQGRGLTRAKT